MVPEYLRDTSFAFYVSNILYIVSSIISGIDLCIVSCIVLSFVMSYIILCIISCIVFFCCISYSVSFSFCVSNILCLIFNTFSVLYLKLKPYLKFSGNCNYISTFKLYLKLYLDFKPQFAISQACNNTVQGIECI